MQMIFHSLAQQILSGKSFSTEDSLVGKLSSKLNEINGLHYKFKSISLSINLSLTFMANTTELLNKMTNKHAMIASFQRSNAYTMSSALCDMEIHRSLQLPWKMAK